MVVGLATIELHIPASHSLKDKRQVLKSLLDTTRQKFNVSAAEVDHLDIWRRATIAVDAETQWELGLSAVLEEKDGTKSYWALAHPEGDRPDFHDPVCFAARLP